LDGTQRVNSPGLPEAVTAEKVAPAPMNKTTNKFAPAVRKRAVPTVVAEPRRPASSQARRPDEPMAPHYAV